MQWGRDELGGGDNERKKPLWRICREMAKGNQLSFRAVRRWRGKLLPCVSPLAAIGRSTGGNKMPETGKILKIRYIQSWYAFRLKASGKRSSWDGGRNNQSTIWSSGEMTTINTNVKALFVRNALQANEASLTSAMQQLSIGKRVDHGGGDEPPDARGGQSDQCRAKRF
jgi:hypothetical protein